MPIVVRKQNSSTCFQNELGQKVMGKSHGIRLCATVGRWFAYRHGYFTQQVACVCG